MFTLPYFLHNLWICLISYSVCRWQAFPAQCNATPQLIGYVCKLWIKWSVANTVPGAKIKLSHILHNLRIGAISYSVCPWEAFPAQCNATPQPIGCVCKLWREWSVVNTVPRAVFNKPQFLHNLRIDSISYSVCPSAMPHLLGVFVSHEKTQP